MTIARPPAAADRAWAIFFARTILGLIDPALDRSMQDRLIALGYSVNLSPMENSPISRVLIGPIHSAAQQQELKSKLSADGFQHFPRRF